MNLAIYSTKFMIAIPPAIGFGYLLYATDYSKLLKYFQSSHVEEGGSGTKLHPDLLVEPTGPVDNVYSVKTVHSDQDVYLVTKLENASPTLPNKNLTVSGTNSYVCQNILANNEAIKDKNCQIYQINSIDNKKLALNVDLLHKQLVPQRDKSKLSAGSFHIVKVLKSVYEAVLSLDTSKTIKIVDKDTSIGDIASYGEFKILFQVDKTKDTEFKTNFMLGSAGAINSTINNALTRDHKFACKFVAPSGGTETPFGCSVHAKMGAITSNMFDAQSWASLTKPIAPNVFVDSNYYVLEAEGKQLEKKDWLNKVVEVYAKKEDVAVAVSVDPPAVAEPPNPPVEGAPIVEPVADAEADAAAKTEEAAKAAALKAITDLAVDDNKLMTLTFDQMLFSQKPTTGTDGMVVPTTHTKRSFVVRKDKDPKLTILPLKDVSKTANLENYRCKYTIENGGTKQVNYDDGCLLRNFKGLGQEDISSKVALDKEGFFRLDINKDLLYNLDYRKDGSKRVVVDLVPTLAATTTENKDKVYGRFLVANEIVGEKIVGPIAFVSVFQFAGEIPGLAQGDKLKCKIPKTDLVRSCLALTTIDEPVKEINQQASVVTNTITLNEAVPMKTWKDRSALVADVVLLQLHIFEEPKEGDPHKDILTQLYTDNQSAKAFTTDHLAPQSFIEVYVEDSSGKQKGNGQFVFKIFWTIGGEMGKDKQLYSI